MAVRTADSARSAFPSIALPFLVAGVAYLVILSVGAKLLNDPDSYWHIVVGRWIIDNGTFPHADPFSFTMRGAPWIAKEWLSQILYTFAFDIAGWPAVAVLAATAAAIALGLLARFLLDELSPLPVILLSAGAFLLATPHLLARPHVLAFPVMVAFVGGLVRAVDRGVPPSFWLLPLMTLWANLHGGFTFGLFLIGAIALDAIVEAEEGTRRRTAFLWARFAVLALIAACITPYGWESILVTQRILGLGEALSIIGEWRPADFSRLGGLELALLAGIGFALWRGFVLRPVRVLILLGLIHMALSAERNGELLGLLAPLFLAAPIARHFPSLAATDSGGPRKLIAALTALLVIAGLMPATFALTRMDNFAPARRITPAAAVDALTRSGSGPVLNDYGFGGYLVYSGVPPFIDGRTELYGGEFMAAHNRAIMLQDFEGFLALLEKHHIGATLLSPATPAVALLDRLPDWRRLYSDDIAVVHIRETQPPRPR
jgi:hypothetical protein